MGFRVDFDALDTMYSKIGQQVTSWQEGLGTLATSCETLVGSDAMSGSGADNVRSYLSNVHGTIQGLLNQLITLHVSNCLLYKQDYMTNIDTSLHAVILESELDTLRTDVESRRKAAISVDGAVMDALSRIKDIFYVSYRDVSDVDAAHISVTQFLQDLDEEIHELERSHMAADFVNSESMISSLTSFIQEQLNQGRSYKTEFSVESLAGSESFRNMYGSYLAVSQELQSKSESIDTAIENENQRVADLQKEYEERQKKANVIKWVVTGVCVIGSIVAIAATGGAATPLVVGAVSGISGAVMAGTNNLADQYVQNGNLKDTDWGDFGKDVLVGGVSGFITGYIGAGVGGAVTSGLSKTATGAALLNSSNAAIRIGTGAVIGATSEVVSGVASRGAVTLVTTGELDEALDAAFDAEQMVYDAAIGGATGGFGEYSKLKAEDAAKNAAGADDFNWEDNYTPEQLEQIREMEANGEFGDFGAGDYDYDPARYEPLENGPYIKDGKPNGRPGPTGKEKLEFEQKIYDNQVEASGDGLLHNPHEGNDVIDWKPGQPKKNIVDTGHKSGNEYRDWFEMYKNREISLDELKAYQSNPDHFHYETIPSNRGHMYEAKGGK